MEFQFAPKLINKKYIQIYNILSNYDKQIYSNFNTCEKYHKNIDKHKIYNINKILEDTKLIKKNTDIYFYYKILDNPFKTIEYNDWHLFSLTKSLNMYAEYYGNSLFDIGSKNIGMGYYFNLTYNIKKNKICLSIQGGSNIYDKESNYKQLLFYKWLEDDLFDIEYLLLNLDKSNNFWFQWVIRENNFGPFY